MVALQHQFGKVTGDQKRKAEQNKSRHVELLGVRQAKGHKRYPKHREQSRRNEQ